MSAQRILIIKHGALGDVVLAMGTMKRLRELHPGCPYQPDDDGDVRSDGEAAGRV